jgi:transposase-like protein
MSDGNNNSRKVICPICDSEDVIMFSLFGETLLTSKYHCNHCGNDFEAIRWRKRE